MPACTLAIYVNDQVYVHIMHIYVYVYVLYTYLYVCMGRKLSAYRPRALTQQVIIGSMTNIAKKNMAQNSMKQ